MGAPEQLCGRRVPLEQSYWKVLCGLMYAGTLQRKGCAVEQLHWNIDVIEQSHWNSFAAQTCWNVPMEQLCSRLVALEHLCTGTVALEQFCGLRHA